MQCTIIMRTGDRLFCFILMLIVAFVLYNDLLESDKCIKWYKMLKNVFYIKTQ